MRRIITGVGAATAAGPAARRPARAAGRLSVRRASARRTHASRPWAALLRPDDGTLFLTLLKVAGWIVWVMLRRRDPHRDSSPGCDASDHARMRGLALPQGMARGLVAATLALFINTNSALGQPAAVSSAQRRATGRSARRQHPSQPDRGTDAKTEGRATTTATPSRRATSSAQIALDHLGNAHRYPEIFKASRDIRQPGGSRLTDPDVIDIGWKLNIPNRRSSAATSPPRRPTSEATEAANLGTTRQPTPNTPNRRATATSHLGPDPELRTRAQRRARPGRHGSRGGGLVSPPGCSPAWPEPERSWPGRCGSCLLRRRAVQHHHRRPGFAIAPPPAATIPVEKTLRHQGRPSHRPAHPRRRQPAPPGRHAPGRRPDLCRRCSPWRPAQHACNSTWRRATPFPSHGSQLRTTRVWTLTLADLPDDPRTPRT